MANKKKKCRHCSEFKPVESGVTVPLGFFCSMEHVTQHGLEKGRRKYEAKKKKEAKEAAGISRAKHRADKEKIKGVYGYYSDLKTVLHRYIKHVTRNGEPCYTCGKQQSPSDWGGAFHVGHYMDAKQADPRRFLHENMRIQCYSCNCKKGGNKAEYRKRLVDEMGIDHVEWLECSVNHKSLRLVYPNHEDIKQEIKKYRALLRESGVTPNG